jgi:hypothetical protein
VGVAAVQGQSRITGEVQPARWHTWPGRLPPVRSRRWLVVVEDGRCVPASTDCGASVASHAVGRLVPRRRGKVQRPGEEASGGGPGGRGRSVWMAPCQAHRGHGPPGRRVSTLTWWYVGRPAAGSGTGAKWRGR